MEYLKLLIDWGPVLVTVASAVAAVTPTPKDNEALRWARRFLDTLALNIANAQPRAPLPPSMDRGPQP